MVTNLDSVVIVSFPLQSVIYNVFPFSDFVHSKYSEKGRSRIMQNNKYLWQLLPTTTVLRLLIF